MRKVFPPFVAYDCFPLQKGGGVLYLAQKKYDTPRGFDIWEVVLSFWGGVVFFGAGISSRQQF